MKTIEDKIGKARDDRANALNSIDGVRKAKVEAGEYRDLGNEFLFGTGADDPGIITIFQYFYRIAYLATSFDTAKPSMASIGADAAWKSEFTQCVSRTGDGSDGIYPPDPQSGVPAMEMNKGSVWLTTNTPNNNTAGGICVPMNAARDAGAAILAKRAEQTSPLPPALPQLIHPDYYQNPERSALLTPLQMIISKFTALRTHIEATISLLESVDAGEGKVFQRIQGLEEQLPVNQIPTLQGYITQCNQGISTAQGELNYFSSFPDSEDISDEPGYDTSNFDSRLGALASVFNSSRSQLAAMTSSISGMMGNSSYPFSGLRAWRYYWISELVGKPLGAYVALDGLGLALQQANNSLDLANFSLLTLFGDKLKYIPTPSMIAVVKYPEFNILGELTKITVQPLAMGSPHVNKYKVYRKEVSDPSSLPLSNDNWSEDDLIEWITGVNSENGMVEPIFTDSDAEIGKSYVYRLRACDTSEGPSGGKSRIDSFNSYSDQSKVISDVSGIVLSQSGDLLTLSAEISFPDFSYIAVMNGDKKGIYLVRTQQGNTVTVKNCPAIVGREVRRVEGSGRITV